MTLLFFHLSLLLTHLNEMTADYCCLFHTHCSFLLVSMVKLYSTSSCSPPLPSSPNTLPPHPDVVAVLLQDPNTLSPVGPSTPQQPTGEPVYAQVNRDRKKQSTTRSDSSSTQALLGSSSDGHNNF